MFFDDNQNLLLYYSNEYQQCPQDNRVFATWQALSLSCHLMIVPFVPLYIFTGYVILTKTPKIMGSTKWVMLNLHVWSSYVDILLCSLITPYFFFPTMSGFPIGLLRVLNVPTAFQTYLGITSIFLMAFSIVLLFESRNNSLSVFGSSRPRNRWNRVLFHSVNIVIAVFFPLPVVLNVPEQNAGIMEVLKDLPCPNEDFFFSPTFIFVTSPFWKNYLISSATFAFLVALLEVFFFSSLIIVRLYFVTNHFASPSTIKHQKTFFTAIIIQVVIPFIFYAIPYTIMVFVVFFNIYDQVVNNLFVFILSLHGFASAIAVLCMHRPYRLYVKCLILRNSALRFSSSLGHSHVKTVKLSRHC